MYEEKKCPHRWKQTNAVYHDKTPIVLAVYECLKYGKEVEQWELKPEYERLQVKKTQEEEKEKEKEKKWLWEN